jgi:cobalt/nickel transport system permease protein
LGYAVWQVFRRFGPSAKRLMLGGFAAGWVSVMIAAVAVAFQLSFSGTSPLVVALPALAIVHVLIGIGEGLITVGALSFIRAARPNLLPMYPMRQTRTVEANQA